MWPVPRSSSSEAETSSHTQPSSLRGYRSDFDSSFADADFDPVEALGLSDSSTRDSSWIGDFSDELSVAVSVREFENAVSLIERGTLLEDDGLPALAWR